MFLCSEVFHYLEKEVNYMKKKKLLCLLWPTGPRVLGPLAEKTFRDDTSINYEDTILSTSPCKPHSPKGFRLGEG